MDTLRLGCTWVARLPITALLSRLILITIVDTERNFIVCQVTPIINRVEPPRIPFLIPFQIIIVILKNRCISPRIQRIKRLIVLQFSLRVKRVSWWFRFYECQCLVVNELLIAHLIKLSTWLRFERLPFVDYWWVIHVNLIVRIWELELVCILSRRIPWCSGGIYLNSRWWRIYIVGLNSLKYLGWDVLDDQQWLVNLVINLEFIRFGWLKRGAWWLKYLIIFIQFINIKFVDLIGYFCIFIYFVQLGLILVCIYLRIFNNFLWLIIFNYLLSLINCLLFFHFHPIFDISFSLFPNIIHYIRFDS